VGGRRRSTLDLFEGRLTVLTGPDGRWQRPGGDAGPPSWDAGGVPVAVPNGMRGGVPNGVSSGVPAAVPDKIPEGEPVVAPNDVPTAACNGVSGGGPVAVPNGTRGGMPGDVPLAVLRVGRDLPDPRGLVRRAYRLGPESAVLVRPEGVVVWRHDGPADPPALASAVRTALGRAAPVAVAV
jgi:hypothetical protein